MLNRLKNIGYDQRGLSQSEFRYVRQFIDAVRPEIEGFNRLIDAYNQEIDKDEKLRQLQDIYASLKWLNDRFLNRAIDYCPDYYHGINRDFFRELQAEFRDLGVLSMHEDAVYHPEKPILDSGSPPEKLANLSFEDTEALIKILKRNDWTKASKYFSDDHHSYTIRVLGGHNSESFILQNITTQEEYVLKIENRLGLPRHAETHLRKNGLSGVLTPMLADRQVSYFDAKVNQVVTRTVLLTTLCEGDLEHATEKHKSNDARIDAALDIYTQMSEVLGTIAANNCIFTDMKNSNWLIDEHGNIKIADTKGFLFTNAEGIFDLNDDDEKNGNYNRVANTPYVNPPEGWGRKPRADQSHAYMLGKNLYQYLTQCSHRAFYIDNNTKQPLKQVHQLDFPDAVFKTERGRALKALIIELMQDDPRKRLSTEAACERLKAIGNPPVRDTRAMFERAKMSKTLLKRLNQFRVKPQDGPLDTLIEKMRSEITEANTTEAMNAIQQRLKLIGETLKRLKSNDARKSVFLYQRNIVFGMLEGDTKEVEQALKALPAHLKTCATLMDEISAFKVTARGVEDTQMNAFFQLMHPKIRLAKTFKEMEAIQAELKSTRDALKSSQAMVQEIEGLSNQSGFDMQRKGLRIADALGRVPLTERGIIREVSEGGSLETEAVLRAMASPRYSWRRFTKEGREGSLDPKKASGMFLAFKAKHQADVIRTETENKVDMDAEIDSMDGVTDDELEEISLDSEAEQSSKKQVLYRDCYRLILEIGHFAIRARGVEDVEMNNFIASMQEQINHADTPKAMQTIKFKLESTLNHLKASESVVREVEEFAEQEGIGMSIKGRRIAEAMVAVPLEKRGAMLFEKANGGTVETEVVLKEMAASQYLSWVMPGRERQPNTDAAITKFNAFKLAHQHELPKRDELGQNKENGAKHHPRQQ
ncbi:MAG: protein kinase [Gammaproteobacteria bacterium]|nr:protein kinase [Gammaproteobacteria bacterium]